MKIKLQNVRIAFPNLFQAKGFGGSEDNPAFSATFLVPKTSPVIKEINAAMEAVAKEKWGAKAAAVLKEVRNGAKTFMQDGDAKSEKYAEYEKHMALSCRTYKRPLVLAADKSVLAENDAGVPYSGCFVNATIEVWAQDNKFGRRINAELKGVQFAKDGDAFGGGAPASPDDFDDLSDQGDDLDK